jgi:hypothetical protein
MPEKNCTRLKLKRERIERLAVYVDCLRLQISIFPLTGTCSKEIIE